MKLRAELAQLLPLLCALSSGSGGPHTSASLALIMSAIQRQLAPSTWLPVLQDSLDLTSLLQSAYQRLAASQPGAHAGTTEHICSACWRVGYCLEVSDKTLRHVLELIHKTQKKQTAHLLQQ